MPWKPSDAQEHTKAADTPEKQKRWAAVANSVLKRCLDKGGEQAECEASALRQAAGVIAHRPGSGTTQGGGASKADIEPGGPEACICPKCGHEAEKERGIPCRSMECPECGTALMAKTLSLPMVLTKARRLADGRVRWQARANTGQFDLEDERFEESFFDDLIHNAVLVQTALSKGEAPPDNLPIPILDVAHYSFKLPTEKRNLARAGWPERVWRDGQALMALGYFDDTPLGRLAAKAAMDRPIEERRISIGVWPDWGRVELTGDGKRIYKGGRNRAYLDHLAMTAHPVDPGTILEVKSMDQKTDAHDVLGDSDEAKGLIDELEAAKEKGLPDGAVIKADGELDVEPQGDPEPDADETVGAAGAGASADEPDEGGQTDAPAGEPEPKALTQDALAAILKGLFESFGEQLDKRLEPIEALPKALEALEAQVEALGATEGEKVKAAVDSGGVWWDELVKNSVRGKSAVEGEAKGPKEKEPNSDFASMFGN